MGDKVAFVYISKLTTHWAIIFSKQISCIMIFELLQTRPKCLTNGNIHLPKLMNAILTNYPEYAVSFNAHEQTGLNDAEYVREEWRVTGF